MAAGVLGSRALPGGMMVHGGKHHGHGMGMGRWGGKYKRGKWGKGFKGGKWGKGFKMKKGKW